MSPFVLEPVRYNDRWVAGFEFDIQSNASKFVSHLDIKVNTPDS